MKDLCVQHQLISAVTGMNSKIFSEFKIISITGFKKKKNLMQLFLEMVLAFTLLATEEVSVVLSHLAIPVNYELLVVLFTES